MCGIAGIIERTGRRADPDAAERMGARLAHRGPDASGSWVSPDGRVAFAHYRLSIIDLDPRANQPMVGTDGKTVVVYNGEIYNHAELRGVLLAAGHRFNTTSSDTEVLIEGYRAWGIDGLLARLDGIFAFALHDGAADITHLVRDRYGIKPLYVTWVGRDNVCTLAFASELRAILAHPEVEPRPDWRHVARYLTFMSVPAPATMIEGVFKVPAGCRLVVDADANTTIVRFHNPASPAARQPAPKSREDIVKGLRRTFADVVEAQMVADVPVGVMLSGGLDSGAILAEASRRHPGLDAYTIAFTDDPDSDESALAAETAARFGARHRVVRLCPEAAVDHVDDVIAAMDEPQADWVCVPLWVLSSKVAATGAKVMLVGEGADELFVGYEHWRTYLGPIARWAALARAAGPLSRAASIALAAAPAARLGWRTRADFLGRAARRNELFWGGAILCWPTVLEAIWHLRDAPGSTHARPRWLDAVGDVGPSVADSPAACVESWYRAVDRARPGADTVERMIAIEFWQRLPELLLMRVDKMTMAHGVEARVPFLARAMVDFALSIPSAEKLAGTGTKALLREAFADTLPPNVLTAPKRGFGAPVGRWLRGPFGHVVRRDILDGQLRGGLATGVVERLFNDHVAGRANHAGLLWALFVLSRWLSISVSGRAMRAST